MEEATFLGKEGINEAEGLDGFWGLFLPPLLLVSY